MPTRPVTWARAGHGGAPDDLLGSRSWVAVWVAVHLSVAPTTANRSGSLAADLDRTWPRAAGLAAAIGEWPDREEATPGGFPSAAIKIARSQIWTIQLSSANERSPGDCQRAGEAGGSRCPGRQPGRGRVQRGLWHTQRRQNGADGGRAEAARRHSARIQRQRQRNTGLHCPVRLQS